jgi:hypothetical protein
MNIYDNESSNNKKLKKIQDAFDYNMKLLENKIAETITNKQKIETMKSDLNEANEKFKEAEKCLEELKIELSN